MPYTPMLFSMTEEQQQISDATLSGAIRQVQECVKNALEQTSFEPVIRQHPQVLTMGKMLRSKLLLYLGMAQRLPLAKLVSTAAAVEMLHAGSLFHDDVIDKATIRRGLTTYWKEAGPSAAILLGDMLFILALKSVNHEESPFLLSALLQMAGEVCQGEALQDIIWDEADVTWDRYIDMVRMKTGSLFAFAALAAADGTVEQQSALREAGYKLGMAYQLADDILDTLDNEEAAGKTLGQDEVHGKCTAASLAKQFGCDPYKVIQEFSRDALVLLEPWPVLHQAWQHYIQREWQPVLNGMLQPKGIE